MELVVGIVGPESLPKFWSNFTDIKFVPIESNSTCETSLSCIIYYYDLLSGELPQLTIPPEMPYILMWVGVDLDPEQISMYNRSSGNYVVKGNIEQYAAGIHATVCGLARNFLIYRKV
jgi:hypothetical protein